MKKILFLLFLFSFGAFAQNSDVGNWFVYFGNKQIDNRWNWHHELQYRNYNFVGDTDQLLIRTGIGYNLSENNNNVLLGYGFVYNEPYTGVEENKRSFIEHRLYQQFLTKQTFGRVSLSHRYRFEQRFIEEDFKLRVRYFLAANIAINNLKMEDKTWYASLYNEIFLQPGENVFDRNRVFVGIGYRFNNNIRTEVGVLNQRTSSVSRNQLNIIGFYNF